jgi:hypothetical protein
MCTAVYQPQLDIFRCLLATAAQHAVETSELRRLTQYAVTARAAAINDVKAADPLLNKVPAVLPWADPLQRPSNRAPTTPTKPRQRPQTTTASWSSPTAATSPFVGRIWWWWWSILHSCLLTVCRHVRSGMAYHHGIFQCGFKDIQQMLQSVVVDKCHFHLICAEYF